MVAVEFLLETVLSAALGYSLFHFCAPFLKGLIRRMLRVAPPGPRERVGKAPLKYFVFAVFVLFAIAWSIVSFQRLGAATRLVEAATLQLSSNVGTEQTATVAGLVQEYQHWRSLSIAVLLGMGLSLGFALMVSTRLTVGEAVERLPKIPRNLERWLLRWADGPEPNGAGGARGHVHKDGTEPLRLTEPRLRPAKGPRARK